MTTFLEKFVTAVSGAKEIFFIEVDRSDDSKKSLYHKTFGEEELSSSPDRDKMMDPIIGSCVTALTKAKRNRTNCRVTIVFADEDGRADMIIAQRFNGAGFIQRRWVDENLQMRVDEDLYE